MDQFQVVLRQLFLHQAQQNGFDFEGWYSRVVHPAWPGSEQALTVLAGESRHYTLLFSHEFARSFWRNGSKIAFAVPSVTYSRVNSQGAVIEVTRKPFTRRTVKPNVWKYHLSQMAADADPIDYIARFIHPQEPAGPSGMARD